MEKHFILLILIISLFYGCGKNISEKEALRIAILNFDEKSDSISNYKIKLEAVDKGYRIIFAPLYSDIKHTTKIIYISNNGSVNSDVQVDKFKQ